MKDNIGFIGCGNMGEAMLAGLINHEKSNASKINVHTNRLERMNYLKDKYQIHLKNTNLEVALNSSLIILAIKPNLYQEVVDEIMPALTMDKTIVSITPSFSIDELRHMTKNMCRVVRSIPNTSSMYNLGFTGIVYKKNEEQSFKKYINDFFNKIGSSIEVSEDNISILSTLSGSSPALIYKFSQSFIKHAVDNGFNEKEAKFIFSKTLLGASKMIEESNINLNDLANQVCSPNGSTIRGVEVFDANNLEMIVDEALNAITNRFIEMTKKK